MSQVLRNVTCDDSSRRPLKWIRDELDKLEIFHDKERDFIENNPKSSSL